jgi:hypothetical protein
MDYKYITSRRPIRQQECVIHALYPFLTDKNGNDFSDLGGHGPKMAEMLSAWGPEKPKVIQLGQ